MDSFESAVARDAANACKIEEQPKLLSIIVPVYNIAHYLDRCVESLVRQSWSNLEILLIDDGSTDDSGKLCDAWADQDARVRVVHEENHGQAAAKNQGIALAKGDYIGFVDADDWLDPNMYAHLIREMTLNGASVGACAFTYVFEHRNVRAGGDTGQVSVYPRRRALIQMAQQEDLMFESTLKVYAREVIGPARFPEGKLYEEIRFAMDMSPRLGTVVYVDKPYYYYQQGRPGSTNCSFTKAKLAIIEDCDAFSQLLEDEGLTDASRAMEAFTLRHMIRMYFNAKACNAEPWMGKQLVRDFRTRYFSELDNEYIPKAKFFLFACSPGMYRGVSNLFHRMQGM